AGPAALAAAGRDGAEAGYVAGRAAAAGKVALAGPGTQDPGREQAGSAASGALAGLGAGPGAGGPPASGHDRGPVWAGDDDPAAALRPDLGTLSYDELLRHTVET